MEVKVILREIVIKDRQSGKEYIVRTLRTAEEIAAYVEESEKDEITSKLEQVVSEAYHQ
jgi:hypothetical protein